MDEKAVAKEIGVDIIESIAADNAPDPAGSAAARYRERGRAANKAGTDQNIVAQQTAFIVADQAADICAAIGSEPRRKRCPTRRSPCPCRSR